MKVLLCYPIAILTFFALIFTSCRSAKYLDDDQALVTKINISGVDPDLKESAGMYVSNEIRPNSPLYLTMYNIFNTSDGSYKTENIKSVGETPRILDSALVELSANQITRFLQTKGYFDAKVNSYVHIKKKKAKIDFRADVGSVYKINNVERRFDDTVLRTIHEQYVLPETPVKPDTVYSADNLYQEREMMYSAMKNNGFYDYLRQYMRAGVDTLGMQPQHLADLDIHVANPDSVRQHTRYTIDSITFRILNQDTIRHTTPTSYVDTTLGIHFDDHTGKFKLKPLARYLFYRHNYQYSLQREEMSYDRLYETNGFRSVKVSYEKVDSTRLNVTYELTPRPAMGNQIEGEFTFSSGMQGFNISDTYSHRNIFGGAEILEIKMRYGVLFDPRLSGSLADKLFNNDFQIGASLTFPRILVPFGVRSVGHNGLPKTTISSSWQYFFQEGTYANQYLINTINYSWFQQKNIFHSYTPIVLEYRLGRLSDSFKQRLEDEGYRLYIESNDRQYFGLGSQYAVTINGNKLNNLDDFSFFRGMVDVSGNTLGILGNILNFKRDVQGSRLVFDVPYLQYIKGEADYRWYKHFGGNRQLVIRLNSGIAVPYGNNSTLLIFEKSFFAGGMNGIRAWQARTLGPGNYNREVLTEDLRLNLRNLDQLGEIKIESNFEYRFRLMNNFLGAKLNGATFVDAGNIWRLKSTSLYPGGEFQADKFLSQIAIGSGFGLRFDMNFFTVRLDAGIKVKDPQFVGKNQWVIKELFNAREFRNEYYQSHQPDRYNFIQYNFGVGMPF